MKNNFLQTSLTLSILASLGSCKDSNNTETETKDAVAVKKEMVIESKFKADSKNTYITWKAEKLVDSHHGKIHASSGIINTKSGHITGGNFIIDLNSITCLDVTDEEMNGKLIGHLKAEDFLDTKKYPNGAFEITSIEKKDEQEIISGNLTLKGIKRNISFLAKVDVTDEKVSIHSDNFTIDRTEFNINYNSAKVVDIAAIGDKLIKDDVIISVHVEATK